MQGYSEDRLQKIAAKYDLSPDLLREYDRIFLSSGIPVISRKRTPRHAGRIVMVSTHGYWGDPPPAGVPDTGGQTYYVLEVSKGWARAGRQVVILARWFSPFPRVESFGNNLWLLRIPAGGEDFVRKEDIYPLLPELAEQAVAVSALFGAHAVMGHYADGMAISIEIGERLKIPAVVIPHSLGINKIDSLGYDPGDPETWLDEHYNFGNRESFELSALAGANLEIANTPAEPAAVKRYYGKNYPHFIMPAGAGDAFFRAGETGGVELLHRYGLSPGRYVIYFGRFSEAKNVPGVVAVFGEAQRSDPESLRGFKLVLVGGSPDNPLAEESVVEDGVRDMMKAYGILPDDIVRLPSQGWQTLSILARHSLCYLGMQKMEPFGMGVAEAMAASAPVIISKAAGITEWLIDERHALIVDPDDPREAAGKLLFLIGNEQERRTIALQGHRLCRGTFSWNGIARLLGESIDLLCRGERPQGEAAGTTVIRREGRAYHRAAFVWRGDPPRIGSQHRKAAQELLPWIVDAVRTARDRNERVIVALGGESGSGKTEIAEYLRFLVRRHALRGVTVSGDAFFRRTPSENHRARLRAYEEGNLDRYLGPQEVDLKRLDAILAQAVKRSVDEISVPSDCRRLDSKRYEDVPVDLSGIEMIFIDLTYSLLLKNVTVKVFLESDYHGRIQQVRERNLSRDPDQDFNFILKVLESEHRIIRDLKTEAHLVVTNDYDVLRIFPPQDGRTP